MILAITAVHLGDIAMVGLLLVGLGWIFHLGRRVIDLWIEHMRWHNNRQLLDEYADDDDTEALADSLRHGRHADVPPATAMETTGFMPRVNVLPVDDPTALRIVDSLSGGER